jgi:hypothetical protein
VDQQSWLTERFEENRLRLRGVAVSRVCVDTALAEVTTRRMLDPDAVIRIDAAARVNAPAADVGKTQELRGATTWATQLLTLSVHG